MSQEMATTAVAPMEVSITFWNTILSCNGVENTYNFYL